MIFCVLLVGISFFLSCSANAQGTVLFIWHGNSNYFQASFVLTDAEMQQGATFSSPEFFNSVSVRSLSGIAYSYDPSQSLILGGTHPWAFNFSFFDNTHGTELFVRAGEPPRGAMAGSIEEKPFSGADLYFEVGHWTYALIPEPSAAGLLMLGAVFWRSKCCKRT
jgi:hypothetical protein